MVSTYAFLVGRVEGGENPSTPGWTTLQEEEKKGKKKLQSLTNQLYYHYTCYTLNAPIITSPPPSMETLQLANLCMYVFKSQTKLLLLLKITLKFREENARLDVNFEWYFWFHLLHLWMPKAIGLNMHAVLFLRDFNEEGSSLTVGLASWATKYKSHYLFLVSRSISF